MIEQLKNKILSYTYEKSRDFHGGSGVTRKDSYIWEYEPNGILLYRKIGAHFFENNGLVHKLHECFYDHDWVLFNKLYELSKKDNLIRTEIPIHNEVVEFNDKKYLYTIVKRPHGIKSASFFNDLIRKKIDRNYFLDFIESSLDLLRLYKEIYQETKLGLPECSMHVAKRHRDLDGYLWIDFKNWDLSYDEFLNKSIVNMKSYALNVGDLLNIDTVDLDKIAEDKWKKI